MYTSQGVGRKLANVEAQHCARPDCSLHTLAASDDMKTYFLQRIIGRIPRDSINSESSDTGMKPTAQNATEFMWLFKWLEYVMPFFSPTIILFVIRDANANHQLRCEGVHVGVHR